MVFFVEKFLQEKKCNPQQLACEKRLKKHFGIGKPA
jgi:hypothetical protein